MRRGATEEEEKEEPGVREEKQKPHTEMWGIKKVPNHQPDDDWGHPDDETETMKCWAFGGRIITLYAAIPMPTAVVAKNPGAPNGVPHDFLLKPSNGWLVSF